MIDFFAIVILMMALAADTVDLATGSFVPHMMGPSALQGPAANILSLLQLEPASRQHSMKRRAARAKRDITTRFLNSIESVEEAVQRSCQTAARMDAAQYAIFERCSFEAQQPRYTVSCQGENTLPMNDTNLIQFYGDVGLVRTWRKR